MRAHRPKHSELHPEAKQKANVRSYARVYQKRGKIAKLDACQRCAVVTTDLEKHHSDYDKPLLVEWLCSDCHQQQTNLDLGHTSQNAARGTFTGNPQHRYNLLDTSRSLSHYAQ
jgi:hypothetical protein